MNIFYISPSLIPSRTANSIHVLNQCAGLSVKNRVFLFCQTPTEFKKDLVSTLETRFSISFDNIHIKPVFSDKSFLVSLRIAFFSLYNVFRLHKKGDLIISRNFYFSLILGMFSDKPHIYETHQLELGWKKYCQKQILLSKNINTIVISKALESLLIEHHNLKNFRASILPDAANKIVISSQESGILKAELINSIAGFKEDGNPMLGYFGHLYPGRGIEIIEQLAQQFPKYKFIVFGGNEQQILQKRSTNKSRNLNFFGHINYADGLKFMTAFDILLMPYQKEVSIGLPGHDTSRWMSPMKMFEYMASGSPIISSDLPVLREVLSHKHNAILVSPENITDWKSAIILLLENKALAQIIAANAKEGISKDYNWNRRAEKIISISYG